MPRRVRPKTRGLFHHQEEARAWARAAHRTPLCAPALRGNEWKYIQECLDTACVSSIGPFVDRFEAMVADRLGVEHAVATVSGTSALHVALLVAGVRPDDEVLVSALCFIAPANAVRYVGAWPVFIDAEPETWQMDPQKVVDFLRTQCRAAGGELRNKSTGRRVRAVVPVHILGHPVDVDPILEAARECDLVVIEDAAEGLGATYKDRPVGALADVACLSFNGNKIVTAGGGGAIVTPSGRWAQAARHLTTQAKVDPVEYVHDHIGYNYRMSNLHAAVGCAQLEQLEDLIAAKRRIAKTYTDAFAQLPGITPLREAPWAVSTCWLYTILVDEDAFGMDSRSLMKHLARSGIQSRPLWQPLHRSPAHAGSQAQCDTVAETLSRRALSLPCSAGLSEHDQQRVIQAVTACCRPRTGSPVPAA